MMRIHPPKAPIHKKIHLSGSKSISNRLLILKEVLATDFSILNISDSEDTKILDSALNQIRKTEQAFIDVAQAGTCMRFLSAYLSAKPGTWTLSGSERMKQRPIGELVNALHELGAEIDYLEKEHYPPIKIIGKQLIGKSIEINSGISSQFISSLLLISPWLIKPITIKLKGDQVSESYSKMTINMLKHFGISVLEEENFYRVAAHQQASIPDSFEVESDWSSASYWYSICALSPGSKIELSALHKNSWQADAILAELFDSLGVNTTFFENSILLEHKNVSAKNFEYNFSNCPDIALSLATCCFALNIPAKLQGLQTLQLKESRRIDALSAELQKLGARVESTSNSLFIEANLKETDLKNTCIKVYDDHRMAMSFAPLCFRFPGIQIESPEVVTKSYPRFWTDLQSVGFSLNLQP